MQAGTGISQPAVSECVRRTLAEDLGGGDLTADIIDAASVSRARVVTREAAVVCGQAWFDEVFRQLDDRVRVRWLVAEGAEVTPGDTLCGLTGPTRALLTGERTALNLLQTLSGTATVAREYARLLAGTQARLLDTRKTLPGLRLEQKYAVRCGGGHNHRLGLYDGILIKENHIAAAGSISAAVALARARHPGVAVEVEVESLAGLDEALAAGADIAMLDNFSVEDMRRAAGQAAGRIKLEASGGIDRAQLRAVADTGVDFVSVGALTKHLRAIDLSMRFDE
ncbi:MAG: carboxylating nicotinate-nucleotide diphosphorylase [Gammaproteobacteria bacterium]|nr:carboxylating nicotinate-nucleotide diphosphorylase [Gammaproteobacteria bacterium]